MMKVRMMLPMSIRCQTCGTYMYKGTKFNTRKEDVEGENYLGIQVFSCRLATMQCMRPALSRLSRTCRAALMLLHDAECMVFQVLLPLLSLRGGDDYEDGPGARRLHRGAGRHAQLRALAREGPRSC